MSKPRWHVYVPGRMDLFMAGHERERFGSAQEAMRAADERCPAEGQLALGAAA